MHSLCILHYANSAMMSKNILSSIKEQEVYHIHTKIVLSAYRNTSMYNVCLFVSDLCVITTYIMPLFSFLSSALLTTSFYQAMLSFM